MSLRRKLEACVAAFGEKAGIDGCALDASGATVLRLGQGAAAVEVTIEALEEEERVLLHAPVLSLGRAPAPELLLRLLALALHGLGTGGGALGWDASRHEAVLSVSYAFADLDAARLEGLLEQTYAAARALREELSDEAAPARASRGAEQAEGRVVIPG